MTKLLSPSLLLLLAMSVAREAAVQLPRGSDRFLRNHGLPRNCGAPGIDRKVLPLSVCLGCDATGFRRALPDAFPALRRREGPLRPEPPLRLADAVRDGALLSNLSAKLVGLDGEMLGGNDGANHQNQCAENQRMEMLQ